jgi:hypothetical protein
MALIKRNVQLSASEGIPHALCPMLLVAPNVQMELGNTQLIGRLDFVRTILGISIDFVDATPLLSYSTP